MTEPGKTRSEKNNPAENLLTERLALSEFALFHTLSELLTYSIDKVEFLTGSRIGFFHFLDDNEQTIHMQVWSTNTEKLFCNSVVENAHYPIELAGVWADCVRQRKSVIHNDFGELTHRKGFPEGHAHVTRELTVPVFQGDKIVAIVGIGNKPSDYNEDDVKMVSELTNLVWEYILSKRLEEALQKSESYARALLGAIPDLIFRLNRDVKYLDYKAAKEDLYYQGGPFIGKNNRDLAPPDFADLVDEKIKLTLGHGGMEIFEYNLPFEGKGIRYYEARMVVSGPDEVTAIARDITERKNTEEALRKKVAELEWFNRMMVDRELRMIELKKEVNMLLKRLGNEEKYVIHQKNSAI